MAKERGPSLIRGCKKPPTFELAASSTGSSGKSIPGEEQAEFKKQAGGQCSWSLVNYRGETHTQGRAEGTGRGLILLGYLCRVLESWVNSVIALRIILIP